MATAIRETYEPADVRKLLRFRQEAGQIWLGEQRMLLLHADYLKGLREELLATLGRERTHGLLFRMGFASGESDARLVRDLLPDAPITEIMRLGPAIHGLEGQVVGTVPFLECDIEKGSFFAESHWLSSWEDEAQLSVHGHSDEAACYSQTGYASGYITALMGKLVVFKELQCLSQGHDECQIIGRPAEEWGENDPWVNLLQPDDVDTEITRLQEQVEVLRERLKKPAQQGNLVGISHRFMDALQMCERAAPSTVTVLLLGETGVGKEMFARWIHDNSPRREKPFVAVNCGAIPNELVEAELFGVEEGAYTGAKGARPGRFERAAGGTIFLDELGELSLSAQVKLLRVLQEGEVERLGGTKTIKVDVRVVAATNVDLPEAIADKTFRADLYYRLNSFPVEIAPLRQRRADIPPLVDMLVERFSKLHGKSISGITDLAMNALLTYDWPGNIRELENTIVRSILLADTGGEIEVDHLGLPFRSTARNDDVLGNDGFLRNDEAGGGDYSAEILSRFGSLEAIEKALIDHALEASDGNVSASARLLGLSRPQLDYRLKSRRD